MGSPYPMENPDLVGHETAEQTLLSAWRYSRLAHAWLITGQRGIGKATLACRFARFVLARSDSMNREIESNISSLYLSPNHQTFRWIAARSHIDFRMIERGLNNAGRCRTQILVEDIRDIGRFLALTPARDGWRVVVIDDAEAMNESAGNALLKVLEEPPSRSLLLLVSHSPGRLLLTVRSRCHILRLRPLRDSQISALLTRYCRRLPPTEALATARLAEGSIGQAVKLANSNGVAIYQAMLDLLASIPCLNGQAMHAFSDRIAQEEGALFPVWRELFGTWLTRLVRRGVMKQPIIEIVCGEEILASKLLAIANLDQWVAVWEKVGRLLRQAEVLNLDCKQTVLNVFCAVARSSSGLM